jgi:hypothetical protein
MWTSIDFKEKTNIKHDQKKRSFITSLQSWIAMYFKTFHIRSAWCEVRLYNDWKIGKMTVVVYIIVLVILQHTHLSHALVPIKLCHVINWHLNCTYTKVIKRIMTNIHVEENDFIDSHLLFDLFLIKSQLKYAIYYNTQLVRRWWKYLSRVTTKPT